MAAGDRTIILWGATGHARVLRDILLPGGWTIAAVFDNRPVAAPWADAPLFIGREGFARWRRDWQGALPGFALAIGSHGFAAGKLALAAWLGDEGLSPLTIVHPSAVVEPSARLGPGAQVLAGAVIGAEARIGAHSIVNTRASIDHDSCLGDAGHLAPGATVCGEVTIGHRAMLGAGCTVLPRLAIGDGALIGAGAVVVRDVAPETRVTGIPARPRP
ncbi:acetyltransferase [Zavarzinia compransoris]|uniref:Sugar acetyltransferase n=1 Tax=Zavarzinia compransoris TaxID=1264899 RepID=A0A317E2Z7_9PROT|nr:acetyltransferase [Zavarzinia compransoris]PWR20804.1 sugar acetyltransferase [Zavarzinia compransoris]TDP44361.1 sugar O-acyltransferase (sialic acid O-acetyltransferase NeuD family) [Zavarzinia compransoris]